MLVALLMLACAKDEAPVLKPVFFESGSTNYASADDQKVIDRAVKVLKTTEFHAVVVGLADTSGDAEQNRVLSQQRADAVAAVLRERAAINGPKRVQTIAWGEALSTDASQSERKVEIVFYTPEGEGQSLEQIVRQSGVLRADRQQKNKDSGSGASR